MKLNNKEQRQLKSQINLKLQTVVTCNDGVLLLVLVCKRLLKGIIQRCWDEFENSLVEIWVILLAGHALKVFPTILVIVATLFIMLLIK